MSASAKVAAVVGLLVAPLIWFVFLSGTRGDSSQLDAARQRAEEREAQLAERRAAAEAVEATEQQVRFSELLDEQLVEPLAVGHLQLMADCAAVWLAGQAPQEIEASDDPTAGVATDEQEATDDGCDAFEPDDLPIAFFSLSEARWRSDVEAIRELLTSINPRLIVREFGISDPEPSPLDGIETANGTVAVLMPTFDELVALAVAFDARADIILDEVQISLPDEDAPPATEDGPDLPDLPGAELSFRWYRHSSDLGSGLVEPS